MYFSDDKIAKYLNANFECSWETLRPVPQVLIDFGNGRKLRRTLVGNIATWYCSPDAIPIDVVPGLSTKKEYLRRAEMAVELSSELAKVKDKTDLLLRYHTMMQGLTTADSSTIRKRAAMSLLRLDDSKSRVENPIKAAIRKAVQRLLISEADKALARKSDKNSGAKILVLDNRHNRRYRMPKLHALLAKTAGRSSVSSLTPAVFKILGVDLNDPYLGLAPYVLGGRLGRHGD